MLPDELIDTRKLSAYLFTFKQELKQEFWDIAYPIGAPFTSFTDSRNPNLILGFGTWVAVPGRFLVGIDPTQTEFDVLGETGGTKTHTLTIGEMPVHHHSNYDGPGGATSFLAYSTKGNSNTGGSPTTGYDSITANTGGGAAHNNLPPYKVVYMWQRTA